MNTLLFTHKACLEHDPGEDHPENPGRLRAVLRALEAEEFHLLDRREAPRADAAQILRVHARDLLQDLGSAIEDEGRRWIDPDTVMSEGSFEAALRAAGAVCAAVDAVMAGEGRNAFCAVRPPGHHATRTQAMGFCFFNNVAVGAAHARAAHGLKRVAIMDFDVHHGNGTQAIFWDEPGVFYASTHQAGAYPGTGDMGERGAGNVYNVPLPAGANGMQFRQAMSDFILPALDAYRPEFVFVSAGFDAHARDPLAYLRFNEEDYAWATRELLDLASRRARGRLVSVLEGGYDPTALAASAAAHVRELMAA